MAPKPRRRFGRAFLLIFLALSALSPLLIFSNLDDGTSLEEIAEYSGDRGGGGLLEGSDPDDADEGEEEGEGIDGGEELGGAGAVLKGEAGAGLGVRSGGASGGASGAGAGGGADMGAARDGEEEHVPADLGDDDGFEGAPKDATQQEAEDGWHDLALRGIEDDMSGWSELLRFKPRSQLFVSKENYRKLRQKDPMKDENARRILPPKSPVPKYWSCALVGNSGILKRAQHGAAIDRHEVVVRLNQAPVEGYELYAGSKTTYRFLNFKWTSVYYEDNVANTAVPGGTKQLARYLMNKEQANTTLVVSRASSNMFELLAAAQRRRRPDLRSLYLSSRMVSQVRDVLQLFDYQVLHGAGQKAMRAGEKLTPSTGLLGVFFLLQTCRHVSVYGLSLSPSRLASEMHKEKLQYHYFKKWADSERLSAHDHHSFDMEGKLLARLADMGVLRLCVTTADRARDVDCGVQEEPAWGSRR